MLQRNKLLFVLLAVLFAGYYLFFACYKISSPGLYHDEVIFLPYTLKVIFGDTIFFSFYKAIGEYPLMIMPYIGALKANLFIPIVSLFGTSAIALRLPMVIISFLGYLLFSFYLHKRYGLKIAILCLIIGFTDNAFIVQSRIDWGPFVLSNFFKLLAIVSLFNFLEKGSVKWSLFLAISLSLGLYDKLNFVWLYVAMFCAVVACYPKEFLLQISKHFKANVTIGVLLACYCIFMFFACIHPSMSLGLSVSDRQMGMIERVSYILRLYNSTFSGSFWKEWIFQDITSGKYPLKYLLYSQIVYGIVFYLSTITNKGLRNLALVKDANFFTILITALVVQLLFTPEVGGAHHLIFIFPFQWLHLILCFYSFCSLPKPVNCIYSRIAATILFGFIFTTQLGCAHFSNLKLVKYLAEKNRPIYVAFDRVLDEGVSEELDRFNGDYILVMDWGIYNPLMAYLNEDSRSKIRQPWTSFTKSFDERSKKFQNLYKNFFAGKKTAVVTYSDDLVFFKDANSNFKNFVSHFKLCEVMKLEKKGQVDKNAIIIRVFDDTKESKSLCLRSK